MSRHISAKSDKKTNNWQEMKNLGIFGPQTTYWSQTPWKLLQLCLVSWRKLSKLFDLCSFITWINYRTTFKFWSARNHPYVASQCAMNVSVKIESAPFKGWAWRPMFAVGCLWRKGHRGQEGGRGESSYLESFHWCPPAYVVALGRADALTLDSFMLLCISRNKICQLCLD